MKPWRWKSLQDLLHFFFFIPFLILILLISGLVSFYNSLIQNDQTVIFSGLKDCPLASKKIKINSYCDLI